MGDNHSRVYGNTIGCVVLQRSLSALMPSRTYRPGGKTPCHRQRASVYRRRRIAVLSPFLVLLVILAALIDSGNLRSTGSISDASKHLAPSKNVGSGSDLRVVSAGYVEPSSGSLGMDDIAVRFSSLLDRGDPNPTLEPSMPGKWTKQDNRAITFDPAPGYVTAAAEKVVVPAETRAGNVGSLGASVEFALPSIDPEVLRIQEVLADLGYLPVHFTRSSKLKSAMGRASELASFTRPPSGTFAWRWSSMPNTLERLWHPGKYGVITQGAVMAFERTHQMIVNRVLSSELVKALAVAALAHTVDPDPYGYVDVSEANLENLTVFEDGSPVFRSLANTGIENSTPIGTWPVYLRLESQTLHGTYPNGVPYDIPDVRYLNYFDGNFAIHAFNRAAYGFPQSAGCVELPLDAAARVWKYLHYGTLVTVT